MIVTQSSICIEQPKHVSRKEDLILVFGRDGICYVVGSGCTGATAIIGDGVRKKIVLEGSRNGIRDITGSDDLNDYFLVVFIAPKAQAIAAKFLQRGLWLVIINNLFKDSLAVLKPIVPLPMLSPSQ